MTDTPSPAQISRSFSLRDIVLLVIIFLGFIGSALLYFFQFPPILVSVFLSTGVSAIIYRYLGGVEGTSFKIGHLKVSGSLAALIGCVWFFNGQLIEQTGLESSFNPHHKSWFALDSARGIPIDISIRGSKFIIPKPRLDVLNNNPLRLVQNGHTFKVLSSKKDGFVYGNIHPQDLHDLRFFNAIQTSLSHFVVTDRLPPFQRKINLQPLPFFISTQGYRSDYSSFSIENGLGEVLFTGNIYRRQGQVFSIDNRFYMIGIVEVNHNPESNLPMYAKFVVGEITPYVDPFLTQQSQL